MYIQLGHITMKGSVGNWATNSNQTTNWQQHNWIQTKQPTHNRLTSDYQL